MKLTDIRVKRVRLHRFAGISLGLMSSYLVGCASVDKGPAVAAPEKQSSAEVATQHKANSKHADKMMATLRAPLVEPVSHSKPKAEKAKAVKTVPVQKIVEERPSVVSKNVVKQIVEKTDVLKQAKGAATDLVGSKSAKPMQEPAVANNLPKETKTNSHSASTKSKTTKPLSIGINDLPVSYDIWTLKHGDTALTQGLVISTPTWEMGKASYVSQIWLMLMEDKLLVNSSSDIVATAGESGIKIDGGALIPFTRIAENNIGVIEGEWLDKLMNAKKLQIYLGFFPDKKPLSKTFKSEASLDNLDRMIVTYRKLLKE